MNPKLLGVAAVLAVFCGHHVTVMPGVIVAAWVLILAVQMVLVAGLVWLAVRLVPRFRSSPTPRLVRLSSLRGA